MSFKPIPSLSGDNASFVGDVLGTGDGNRITNDGIPYLISGDSPAETQNLDEVLAQGNTSSRDMQVETVTGFQFEATGEVGLYLSGPYSKIRSNGGITLQTDDTDTRAVFGDNYFYLRNKYSANDVFRMVGGNAIIGSNTTPLAKLDVRGDITGLGDFLGTGVGNRITNNGVPYLLSGDSPAENDTLQDVTTRGNETTTSIISTGPYISGVTGLFSDKVGIGVSDPTTKLEVSGAVSNSLAAFKEGSQGVEITTRGSNRQQIDFLGSNSSTINAKASLFINYDSDNGGSNDAIYFARNGADAAGTVDMTITEGDVGIGTTSPNNKLDVVGSASIDVLQHQSESTNYWALGTSASYQQRVTSRTATAITQVIEGHSSQSADLLQIRSSSASDGDYVTVNSDGDVGIGTTGPSFTSGGGLQITHATQANLRLSDSTNASYNTDVAMSNDDFFLVNRSATGHLKFRVNNSTEAITVLQDGKVGIGTTNPTSKLYVSGQARIDGSTTDGLTITSSAGASKGLLLFNNSNTDTASIINFYDGPLVLGQANAEVMRIHDNGKVGIGITSPEKNLSIGDAQAEGIQFNYGATNNYRNQILNYWNSNADSRMDFNIARTSGQTPVTIMSVGYNSNVGIGTTNPASILHVEAATPTVTVKGTSTASSKVNLINGSVTWSLENQYVGGATTNMFRIFNSSLGVDALTIHRANNNVGIGTTSPSRLLTLENNSSTVSNNSQLRINNIGAGDAYIYLFAGSDWSLGIDNSDSDKFKLCTSNDVSDGNEVVTVDRSGNVGIGTTSPAEKLTVIGDILIDNGGDSTLYLGKGAEGVDGVTKIKAVQTGADTDQLGIAFNVHPNTAGSAVSEEAMRIDHDGNVGIGTTSPSNALDVVGHFSATSKSFLINHPTKENKKLQYASLEGPENGVYVRGTTDKETIELPEYWSELVHEDSITVVLTPIGKKQDLFIKEKSNKLIKIGGAEGSFDYVVYGERKDIDKLEIEPLKV